MRTPNRLAKGLALAVCAASACGAAAADLAEVRELAAELQICQPRDPQQPASAFDVVRGQTAADGDYWVAYRCKQVCVDWRSCQAPGYWRGQPLLEGDEPRAALAFVVGGMAGHLAFTTRQTGAKTVFLHDGVGGTRYMTNLARQIEAAANTQTIMVRWENGFRSWGWFTRPGPEATRVPALTRRVASLIAWVHEHLAGAGDFGTVGCSMGTQATLGAVVYYGVDAVVDYQLMVGGPPLWDLNAGCGRRRYASGFCDLDPAEACRADADCAGLSPRSQCIRPGPIPLAWLYESVVNHVHATQACDVANASVGTGIYPPFDESGFAFAEADWDVDHPIDFQLDLWGPDGDAAWALGDMMHVFNSIRSATGHRKRWLTTPDANHCAAIGNGRALAIVSEAMNLAADPLPPRLAPAPADLTLAADGDRASVPLASLFLAEGESLVYEARSDSPALVAAQIVGDALVLEANAAGSDGTATITVRATNRAGQSTTASFQVAVTFSPPGFLRHWRLEWLRAEQERGDK